MSMIIIYGLIPHHNHPLVLQFQHVNYLLLLNLFDFCKILCVCVCVFFEGPIPLLKKQKVQECTYLKIGKWAMFKIPIIVGSFTFKLKNIEK